AASPPRILLARADPIAGHGADSKKDPFMKSFTADQVRLGFVGVGAMGGRIVRRLRDHGYQVSVYNRNRAKAEALLPYGVSVTGSLADLGMSADVILSCLSDDDAVRNVYLGQDGILASSR